jgi:NADH-quinone oxidoreductase subunit M
MSYALSLLIFLPFVGSAFTYIAGRWRRQAGLYTAVGFTTLTLLISAYAFWFVYANTPQPGQYALVEGYSWVNAPGFVLNYLIGADGLSSPLVLVSALLTLLAVTGSRNQIDRPEPIFYAQLLFVEGSVMGVFVSLNLIMFYIFWELTLIPMFFLIGVWGGERRRYAAMKFILFTFTGSAIMLLGFLSLYLGVSPQTFDIPSLAGKVPAGLQYLPLLATFIGFAVELPAFPFHSWQPDAYEQAPAPVNVLLAGVLPKFAGFGLIRISVALFPQAAYQYAWAFIVVGIVSMFYGAIVAVLAKDLKRMFAYTSINHMGFILFGVFATVASGNPLGVEGAILLMFVHALAVGSLFTISGYIQKQSGTREISGLKGIRQRMPLTSTLLVFSSCAAMALPPFATFLAELMVISAGISANSYTAITILVPVITGGYFLWMLKRTVLTPADKPVEVNDISRFDAAVFTLYLIPMILIIVFSFLILSPAAPVAKFVVQLGGQP